MENELSEELRQKLKACTTDEELEAVAKDAGAELSHKTLQSLAGGALYGEAECPRWRSCENYCQTLETIDSPFDCTWVSQLRDSKAELICDNYTH